jgi:PD-(D/E)XK nuclease superfamily
MSISDADQKAIENFVTSEDLVQLETRFAQFNIFEALSVARRELTHSSFLAFLLDPYRGHGLRDLFLRRFLQEAVRTSEKPTEVTAIDIHLMDLTQSEVKREHGNIDLLIKDPRNRLVVVIENKVDSEQHSNQLARYREQTQKNYLGYRWIGILLSLEGERPRRSVLHTVHICPGPQPCVGDIEARWTSDRTGGPIFPATIR